MLGHVLRRLVGIIPLVLLLALVTFALLKLAPGGPFSAERALPPEIERQLEEKFLLDRPFHEQYFAYVGGILDGTLPSLKRPGETVGELIATSVPASFMLGSMALMVALALGIPAGVIAALRQNSWLDYGSMSIALVGISVPNFVLGPLLVSFFALQLGLLPPALWDGWQNMILPAVTLGAAYAAYVARLTRAGMLEVIRSDFVRTARAKGLSEVQVVLRHALKGGLLPVVTWLGPATARILTGTVVIEKIFNVPGLGYYFVQSALDRDYSMVLGVVMFYATLLMIMNLLVDVAYTWLDPRVEL